MEDSETQRRHMLSESSMASESENALMDNEVMRETMWGFVQEQGYSSLYEPWLVEFLVFFGSWQPIVSC